MKLIVESRKKFFVFIQFVLIVSWVSHLVYTDSYFSVYALCCALAVACLFNNYHNNYSMGKRALVMNLAISSLLSLAVTLANYPIFQRVRNLNEISMSTNQFMNMFEFVLTFAAGVIVFYHIILCACCRFPLGCIVREKEASRNQGIVFWGSFGIMMTVYLVYLFLVVYPGSVSGDSVGQIAQGVNNLYANNHPFWHTVVIKWLLNIGYSIFNNPNAAVATYSVVQGLTMAICFSYALMTLYQYGVPIFWIFVSFSIFAFLPYNIAYSATMWKDVPFGVSMLLFTVSAFRIIRHVGRNQRLNYLFFVVGGIGTCIMRTNGWVSLMIASVIILPYLWKMCKSMVITLVGVLVFGWILVNPVLSALNVAETNFVEILSIPAQQIARVITCGGYLTEEETEMLGKVVDLDEIPLIYDESVSDPIKDELILTNRDYLQENLGEYARIWLSLGRRYPGEYLKAWVEQTKGYWNSGYEYYIYAEYVKDNDFGIYMPRQSNIVHKLVKAYFTFTRESVFFEPFQSIGLHTWIMIILCFVNIVHKKQEAVLFVPCFVIIGGLMLGAPVFSLFRYVYPIFTIFPFLMPVTLYGKYD